MAIKGDCYTKVDIKSQRDFLNYGKRLPKKSSPAKWIFRGQKCHGKERDQVDLMPSLERTIHSFYRWPKRSRELKHMRCIECWSLREFKRKLYHYTQDVPQENDKLEWLALMQHYGAPTRLLDWTYSFFVAAFFAVESSLNCDSEVWALNANYFDAKHAVGEKVYDGIVSAAEANIKAQPSLDGAYVFQQAILDHLWKNPTPCVCAVNPLRLNERLTIQQGVFLFPGDIQISFEDNLRAAGYSRKSYKNLVRFMISASLRTEILEWLHPFNINYATLFPGLDGFARSFATRVGFHPDVPTELHCKSVMDSTALVDCCEIKTA